MKTGLSLFFLFFTIAVLGCSKEKQSNTESTKPLQNLDIYLLIGQSNMAGRAPVEGADLDTLERVYLFVGTDSVVWEPAANPLNKYSTIRKSLAMQKLGPGYSFAREVARANPEKNIGLVVNAKGGTNINEWLPGTLFYNEAVGRTKAALQYGTLKGIVWHQGEANASKYYEYLPKLIQLIKAFRADFGNPELPFVAGQLSEDRPKRIPFNQMILSFPDSVSFTGVATSEGTATIDSTHFNPASQHLMGERYARKMLEIQNLKNQQK